MVSIRHEPYAMSLQPLAIAVVSALALTALAPAVSGPHFELVQPELFSANGGQTNAWADFDNDGDLDEFVGFRGRPNRLYRQDHGRLEDVAAAVGLADTVETRVAAWGISTATATSISTSASSASPTSSIATTVTV